MITKKRIFSILLSVLFYSTLQAQETYYEVSTFAGSDVRDYINGKGENARFKYITSISYNAYGHFFLIYDLNRIRKIDSLGIVSDFSGTGIEGDNIDDLAKGTKAQYRNAGSTCMRSDGFNIIADQENYKLKKIDFFNKTSTFVGNGIIGLVNGKTTKAQIGHVKSMCANTTGYIYLNEDNFEKTGANSDLYQRFRKIAPNGNISTFIPFNGQGYLDGDSSVAKFTNPLGICSDLAGNIYVADYGNDRIRKISPNGMVTTFAGNGDRKSIDGNGLNASFIKPVSICCDALGNLYVYQFDGNIRKISPKGDVKTIAKVDYQREVNYANGIWVLNKIFNSNKITVDKHGNVYVALIWDEKIIKLTPKTPKAPRVEYQNLSGALCLGSTINETATEQNSQLSMTAGIDSSRAMNQLKDIAQGRKKDFYAINGNDLGYDTLLHYNLNGTVIDTIFPLTYMKNLCTDAKNNVYIFSNNPGNEGIYMLDYTIKVDTIKDNLGNIVKLDTIKLDNLENVKIGSKYQTSTFDIYNVFDMEIGPDGNLYACDSIYGLQKINTSDFSNVTNINIPFAVGEPFTVSFGKGEMYLFNKNSRKIWATSFPNIGSYTQKFNFIDSLDFPVDIFEYDTTQYGMITVANTSQNKLVNFCALAEGFKYKSGAGMNYSSLLSFGNPNKVMFDPTMFTVWLGNSKNKLASVNLYGLTITPELPRGLSFNPITKKIMGVAMEKSPLRTYKIIASNYYGTDTVNMTFSIDPQGPISNSQGAKYSEATVEKGLSVNFFEKNNCEQIMNIEDKGGNNKIGTMSVSKETKPTIISFESGNKKSSFTRTSYELNAENNTDIQARVKFYFTYLDVEHFNSSNDVADADLVNDTIGGKMQVAVLQRHNNGKGGYENIKHNPITATWKKEKQAWEVDFEVNKFSTFYMGTSNTVNDFTCSSEGPTETITSCGYYFWRGKVYNNTGVFKDTTVNQAGCDSILTLNLTVKNDFEITQDELFPEYLTCNTAGASYQWINCDNGGTILTGETAQDFTATYNGSFAVIATKNNCTDTSLCVTVSNLADMTTSLENSSIKNEISIYPNPSSSGIFVLTNNQEESGSYKVLNANGIEITSGILEANIQNINLSSFPKGLYFIKINNNVMKIIKE